MNNTTVTTGHSKPWYRHYWVWLIILPPLSAVVAGISTVVIATQHAPALVVDDYRKIGLANHLNLERDLQAARKNLTAALTKIDKELVLSLSSTEKSDPVQPGTLTLVFTHPTLPDRDFEIALGLQVDGAYKAIAPPMAITGYRLQLLPVDQDWRLIGRWLGPAATSHLNPGVDAD